MWLWILTIIFLIVYGVLIFFYYHHWKGLKEYEADVIMPDIFISLVIAARNEEKNLPLLLKALHQQTYPKHLFEIIIIDDFSTDNTAATVREAAIENVHLIQPETEQSTSSKKKAIEAGIKKAKGELIVITDADCIVGTAWLQTIVSYYKTTGAVFIAAPVKFYHNNTVLQLFQAIDFITLQGITAASVSAGFHTMCNGANLAYTKAAFKAVNGFAGIDKVASGDDMLLMYKIWKLYPQRVHYLKSKKGIVATQPMPTWKEFVMQRRRWASKTLRYDDYRVFAVLAFVYLFNLLFIVLLIAAMFNAYYWWVLLVYLSGKIIIEVPFVNAVTAFYEEQKIMKYFPFFQPLHIFYTVSVGLLSQLGKYQWKGRTTK